MKNLLYVAGAGILAYLIFRKVQFGQKTKLLFSKINLVGKGLAKKFELVFKVQNPTNASGTISAITGEVFVNGKSVADFSAFGEQKISARSESDLKIIAQPSQGIVSLLTSKGWLQKGISYTIKGTANFDGIVAPFEFQKRLI